MIASTSNTLTMQAVALTSAMLVASAAAIPSVPLGATPCAGKAPGWCKKWKVDNAPFYNCSGSDAMLRGANALSIR